MFSIQEAALVRCICGNRSELHRRKLSAVLPCERVTPVCQRISYRIVGYRRVAVCRQLVLPVAVAVGVCRSVCRRNSAQTAPRQRIDLC